jgi:hypothetical protein
MKAKKAKTKAKAKRKTGTALVVHKPRAPARPPENASPLEMVIWAAQSREINADKLRELVALRNEMEDRQKATEFAAAFKEAKDRIPVVVRDATNEDNRAKYSRLETVSRAVDPVIKACGLACSYTMAESNLANHYRIVLRVTHLNGHFRESFIDLPADDVGIKGNPNKTRVQGAVSTTTYARRVLKVLAFDVNVANNALPDDDGNLAGDRGAVTPATMQQIVNAIEDAGLDKGKFCEVFQIEGIAQLPAARAREALDRIEQYRKQHARMAEAQS